MPTETEKDSVTGTETTGHEWDGIKELDTPLPKWWVYVFYATIIWSVVYFILYPSVPGISGYWGGLFDWSMRVEHRETMSEAAERRSDFIERIRAASLEEIRTDDELRRIAFRGGEAAFNENCAACHAIGGRGRPGFPNLVDDAWIWGGTLQDIEQTIRYGIRSDHAETRESRMIAFGREDILDREQIAQVAEYVLSLTGRAEDQQAAEAGGQVFAQQCASCHGPEGGGQPGLGAPALNDRAWLRGNRREDVIAQVNNPQHGVMPAWEGRLSDPTIKMLTVYVHSRFGGGQ